jgi:hypothetical protein
MLATLLLAFIAVVIGAGFCFAGYRLFLVMLPIWGFFAGFWIGAQAISLLLGGGFLATTTGLVVGVVVGFIGAVLSYLFYTAGVLIIAAGFGGAVGSGLMSALGFDAGFVNAIVTLISAIIAAGLTLLLNLQKLAVTVFTAIFGAGLVVLAGMMVFGQVTLVELQGGQNFLEPILQGSWFWGLVWLVLVVVGAVAQIRANQTYEFKKEMYVEGWG